jgi:hypothetical protein
MRFVGLALEDRVPDAKTIWLLREQLTRPAPSSVCSPGPPGRRLSRRGRPDRRRTVRPIRGAARFNRVVMAMAAASI